MDKRETGYLFCCCYRYKYQAAIISPLASTGFVQPDASSAPIIPTFLVFISETWPSTTDPVTMSARFNPAIDTTVAVIITTTAATVIATATECVN